MSFPKFSAAIAAIILSTSAHAQLSAGHGARAGATAGSGAVGSHGQSAGQSGSNGGRYLWINPDASLVDQYQPWPESEMRKFQKPSGDQQ